ncbi:MAG TPA: alpha/beta hydrolase, partial [Nocardioides sp.]|nr:alpha/beta hydrolase [Nocardioides sp.]HRK45744.1 alpha/beta hydrolase [Nocardioides sp.]
MRWRTRWEKVGLVSAMALPERAQRALAGRPVTRDGLTLATDVQLMLRMQRLARVPGAETVPLARGRVVLRE